MYCFFHDAIALDEACFLSFNIALALLSRSVILNFCKRHSTALACPEVVVVYSNPSVPSYKSAFDTILV